MPCVIGVVSGDTSSAYTKEIIPEEPHSSIVSKKDVKFNYEVGDPPEDPGYAYPGLYNHQSLDNRLRIAGTNLGDNYQPLQGTNAHKRLPTTPGYIRGNDISSKAGVISIEAINDSIDDHTRNIYSRRDIEDLRISSRTLMYSTGFLYNLQTKEVRPLDNISSSLSNTLKIGAAKLTPAVKGDSYKGENYTILETTSVVFPFNSTVTSPSTGNAVIFQPGETGHQFTVEGGTQPYRWSLRPLRNRRAPEVPLSNPNQTPIPIPFDQYGDYIEPPINFPEAVMEGGLPPGMLLNKFGLLYGTPEESGQYIFRLHVKDDQGRHGEETITLTVLSNSQETPPCSEQPQNGITYKTTIIEASLPKVTTLSWKGKVIASGGTKPYVYELLSQTARKIRINQANGDLVLNSVDLDTDRGLWVYEARVYDTNIATPPSDSRSCDRRAVLLPVMCDLVAGEPENISEKSFLIPEGDYVELTSSKLHLVLNPPEVVKIYPQGKNLVLAGAMGTSLRPDLSSGPFLGPGPITSVQPGIVNPVSAISVKKVDYAPAFYQLDWTLSNPVKFFQNIVDRFDQGDISGDPETEIPLEGAAIDNQIPVGKRIRPLWPL
jgi:hypothetical protein